MIVVDASVLVDAFIGTAAAADRLGGVELHAPHLIDLEVASALRRLVAADVVAEPDAAAILGAMQTVELHRHDLTPLIGCIWSIRNRVNPYDGAYVALATALGVPLVTTDRKLASAPGVTCAIELVKA